MQRPPLSTGLTGAELRSWYWTMAELQPFARTLKVRAAGPKAKLIDRIAAHLDGISPPDEPPARTPGLQLTGELTMTTQIPVGQRSTTELRLFFEEQIGPTFTFNGHMRVFLAAGDGTLGDAVAHFHQTKGTPLPKQSASLEFNAFTKAWHAANPGGAAADCRAAWLVHRSLPADQRPPVSDPG